MSKITELASGQITISDHVTVVLVGARRYAGVRHPLA